MVAVCALINVSAWASALLVLTRRAMPEPQWVGRADRMFPTLFCFCPNSVIIINRLDGNRGKKKESMDFTIPKKYPKGKLNPNDVSFFYYDVGFPLEESLSGVVEWTDEIKSWICEHSITVGTMEEIPANYDWEENTLYIEVNKGKNFAQALLHHLRNGFAHYRITEYGDSFMLEDKYSEKPSMKGRLKKSDLKELVIKLRSQMETFRDALNDMTNRETI